MCSKHYNRTRKYGDPLIKRSRWAGEAVASRFWAKVSKNGPLPEKRPELGPCWVWQAARQSSGYGFFENDGAHRVAYEFMIGPIPAGLELDHLCHPGDGSCLRATCRHRLCVNPAHLEPVTRFENMKRGNTFTAANALKTHCPKGHEYTPENTRVRVARSGNEMRSCKECERYVPKGQPVKTHCPQGHEYTPENTIIEKVPGGIGTVRRCRKCRKEQAQRSYRKRSVAAL